ncbi:hypothetical protein Tco_0558493 [Tanacetum coccineum]
MWIVSRGVVLILALVEVLRVLRGFLLGTFFQSSTVASLSNKIWGILLIFSLVIVGFTSPSGHSNSRQNTRFKLFGIIISVVVIQDGDEVACDDEYCLKKKTWSIA